RGAQTRPAGRASPVASSTRSAYGAMARRCGTVLGRYVVPALDEARHVRSGSNPASGDAAFIAAGRQAPKQRRAEPGSLKRNGGDGSLSGRRGAEAKEKEVIHDVRGHGRSSMASEVIHGPAAANGTWRFCRNPFGRI